VERITVMIRPCLTTTYSLTELADLAGVTRARSATTWRVASCRRSARRAGQQIHARHLARLQLIRRLQAEHLPLAEIRRRLETLGDDEIATSSGRANPRRRPTARSSTCGPFSADHERSTSRRSRTAQMALEPRARAGPLGARARGGPPGARAWACQHVGRRGAARVLPAQPRTGAR
jgi:hypothetical protein